MQIHRTVLPWLRHAHIWFGIAVCGTLSGGLARAAALQVDIHPAPDRHTVELRLQGDAPAGSPVEARLQHSADLKTWSPVGSKVRLPALTSATGLKLADDAGALGFFRLATRDTTFAATEGADILGYNSSFADQIDALGLYTVEDFAARYAYKGTYWPGISWDPTNSLYWDAMQRDVEKPSRYPMFYPPTILPGFKLSLPELARFRTNGFVVSERLGNDSFGDVYYDIFTRDLPVFISTDSILHAWHRSFDGIVQVVEDGQLRGQLREVLLGMLGQLPAAKAAYGAGVLKTSLEDSEYFLAVAAYLIALDTERPTPLPADLTRFNQTLKLIGAAKPVVYQFFDGQQRSEIVDFSQYTPRGHYAKWVTLQRYFQAMMWLGRVDLRVAGNPDYASLRQLGTAIVLNDLLDRANQRSTWRKIDNFITTFIGPSDSMNFDQLDALLKTAGITSPVMITSNASLESLRAQIEAGTLGTQAIQGHSFVGSAGNDQIKLPRSFTFLGQRFTVDSWTFSQMVMDRIVEPGSQPPRLVRRRLPYSLDVGFAVFANNQLVPELIANMTNPKGVPFRDGYPYQRNLAAVRQVLDDRPAEAWTGSLYDRWLLALRTLSTPTTGPEFPEAMRTRAWAMKTVNTQLASWSELRHDTVLYAKQSETPPILCQYPHGYVEPIPEFYNAMKELALQAAQVLEGVSLPRFDTTQPFNGPFPEFPRARPSEFLHRFATNCETLGGIATKQLLQKPLATNETAFLENTIEQVITYFGDRQYNGWYPRMFYWGTVGNGVEPTQNALPDHDSVFPDFLVADVHTDGFSEPDQDPGAVLHEAVGKVNLLMIAVDNGPDRMVFVGPVLSHYEFTKPYGTRLTDEQWKASVKAGTLPAPPPWTESYLVPKP